MASSTISAPLFGALQAAFSKVAKADKKAIQADVKKLQTGKGLGLSEAEKEAGTAGAIQSAQAAQAALIDNAQRTGDYGALAKLGEQASNAGAGARLGMEQTSQQLAQQRTAEIRDRMAARRQELINRGKDVGEGGKGTLTTIWSMTPLGAGSQPSETNTDDLRGAAGLAQ